MAARTLTCLLALLLCVAGCTSPEKKKAKEQKKEDAAAVAQRKKELKEKPSIPDMSRDTAFQSFLGRLRLAVSKRDRVMIGSLLAPDFGYSWEQPPAGETPFDYWDKNNLWEELNTVLADHFAPHEAYMVSPPQFLTDPSYRGFRAGVRVVNGSWRFAYFINGEDLLQ